MESIDVIKNQVYQIINENDLAFKNNEQFCFACGVALTILLFSKEYSDNKNTEIYKESLNSNNLMEFYTEIVTLIEQNADYIDKLPPIKKNLFRYIMNYTPYTNIEFREYLDYFMDGTSSSTSYFESMPVIEL